MKKLAVFASGSGSNFAAIVQAIQSGELTGTEVSLLVCDRPGAYVLERAREYGIPAFVFDPKAYPDKAAFETEIAGRLQELGIDWVVLAGYMRLIGPVMLRHFERRMINLHPSLLPAFPGKDAIGQALAYGVKVTGVTVHFVDAGMDTGPIIAQQPVAVQEGDTAETLASRIHQVEHQLLVGVIRQLLAGAISIEGRQVRITARS